MLLVWQTLKPLVDLLFSLASFRCERFAAAKRHRSANCLSSAVALYRSNLHNAIFESLAIALCLAPPQAQSKLLQFNFLRMSCLKIEFESDGGWLKLMTTVLANWSVELLSPNFFGRLRRF
jgi:hypothetical protein